MVESERGQADAKLMAASKDMLQTLRECLPYIDNEHAQAAHALLDTLEDIEL
jgi:hypothetical protein